MADSENDLVRVLFSEWQRGYGGPPHAFENLMPEAQAGWRQLAKLVDSSWPKTDSNPIPMRLHCPECGELHVDEGEFATKPHHTHACQNCGMVWRPAVVPTVGVHFLPGFHNEK